MKTIDGKTVFITGGNAGIGKATALRFAEIGCNVAIAARREKEGQQTVEEIFEKGGEAIFIKTDVRNEDEVEFAISQTVKKFGALDYAFNNAGINPQFQPIHMLDMDNWTQTVDINLTGVLLSMKHEIKQMLKQGEGVIVNMSSVAGLTTQPHVPSAYSATKHGIIGLTKNAAMFYAKENIRVNAICPGVVETQLIHNLPEPVQNVLKGVHPMNRYGKLEEIADTVVWLCSEGASFVTGQALAVDGGLTTGSVVNFGGQ